MCVPFLTTLPNCQDTVWGIKSTLLPSGNCTPGSRSYSDLGQTLPPPAPTQALFKVRPPESTVPFGLQMCPLWSGLEAKCALCPLIACSNHLKYFKASYLRHLVIGGYSRFLFKQNGTYCMDINSGITSPPPCVTLPRMSQEQGINLLQQWTPIVFSNHQ